MVQLALKYWVNGTVATRLIFTTRYNMFIEAGEYYYKIVIQGYNISIVFCTYLCRKYCSRLKKKCQICIY